MASILKQRLKDSIQTGGISISDTSSIVPQSTIGGDMLNPITTRYSDISSVANWINRAPNESPQNDA